MRSHRFVSLLPLTVALACGRTARLASSESPASLSVSGAYDTAVSLGENSCGQVTIEPNVTTIAQTPGTSSFTLSHAGIVYNATLGPDGRFSTAPKSVGGNGSTYGLGITGRFTSTGLEADVRVDVQQQIQPSTCHYIVHWVGTRRAPTGTR